MTAPLAGPSPLIDAQTFALPEYFHDSSFHVETAASGGCGMTWKIHFSFPVRASFA